MEVVGRWLVGELRASPEQIVEAATRQFLVGAQR